MNQKQIQMRNSYKLFWTLIFSLVMIAVLTTCFHLLSMSDTILNYCGVVGIAVFGYGFIVAMNYIWLPKKKKKIEIPDHEVISDPLESSDEKHP